MKRIAIVMPAYNAGKTVEKVFARKSGLNILVDVHLEVDDNMTVLASHRLGHAWFRSSPGERGR